MSNQVVRVLLRRVLRVGQPSRAKLRTTRSPSATIATSGALTRASIGCRLPHLGEEVDERGAPGRDVRVVLDVRLGHVLVGELHVARLRRLRARSRRRAACWRQGARRCWREAPPDRWPPAPRPVPKRPRRQEARRRDNTAGRVCSWRSPSTSERSRFDPASRRGIVSSPHGLRPRSLRRHRRPDLAKADAGAVPGLASRQAARRRPHPRRLAPGTTDDAYRAWIKERFAEVEDAKRPSDDEFDRFAALLHYLRLDLSQPGDYARLKDWLASPVGRAAPADVVVMFLATSPDLFPVVCAQLGAAGLNGPNVRVVLEKPLGHDLASAQRDQPRRPLGVQRSAGIPHRPLPRQAGGAEPDGAALRQRPVRAALAARVHRQHPDHARRIDRRRHARRLLRPHRRVARHDPEPRAAAADDGHDGAAVANGRRRDPRREAEGAALAQAVQRPKASAATSCAASTAPAASTARRCRASWRKTRWRRQHDRDLRRAAHRGAELALGRRAVLPAHRQAPGRARCADRRQLPAHAAHALSGQQSAQQAGHQAAARGRPRAAPARRQGRRARPRRSRRCRSISTSTRRSRPTASAPTSGCCSTSSPAGSTCSFAATSRRKRGAGSSRSCDDWRRDDAGPRPYTAGTWGPAAASALVARDGYAWAEEE